MLDRRDWMLETNIIPPACRERFLPLDAPEARRLRQMHIFMAGLSDLKGAYRQVRPDPPFHLVLYTLAGSGRIEFGPAAAVLKAGDVLLAPAHQPYRYAVRGASWRIMWFHMKVRRQWDALGRMSTHIKKSELIARMHAAMDGLFAAAAEGDGEAGELYCGLIEVLLKRQIEPRRLSDPMQVRLSALWREVDESLGRRWTVHALARRMNMSSGHLHRVVLERKGISPMQYVARLRMKRAKMLLIHTDEPIKSVAGRVGYESQYAFSSAFKRHEGLCPSRFVTKQRAAQNGAATKHIAEASNHGIH